MALGVLAPTITAQAMANGDVVIRTYKANPVLVNQNNQSLDAVIRIAAADWAALVAGVAGDTLEHYATSASFQYDVGNMSPVALA